MWKCRERVKEQEMSRGKWQISERWWAWGTGKRFLAFVRLHSSPSQTRKTMTKMNGLEEDQHWDKRWHEQNRDKQKQWSQTHKEETRSRKSLWSQNFQLTYVRMRWTISNERIKRTLTDLAAGGPDKEDFLIKGAHLSSVWAGKCADMNDVVYEMLPDGDSDQQNVRVRAGRASLISLNNNRVLRCISNSHFHVPANPHNCMFSVWSIIKYLAGKQKHTEAEAQRCSSISVTPDLEYSEWNTLFSPPGLFD